jgi:CHASE2 domain-containing sensor protein/anti-sigma regulatory factor (Ser/Thr protein kinase)
MFPSIVKFWQKAPGFVVILVFVSLLVSLVRGMGSFEHEELDALDRFFQSRPSEPTDSRIVIVGITEQDLQKYRQYPFSDAFLANLIEKIKAQNPRVIGLDIIRDIPQPPGHEQLNKIFQTTPNLIGAGKLPDSVEDDYDTAINFPPVLKQLHRSEDPRIADITCPLDEDYVVRKAFLHPITSRRDLAGIPSLGAAVARKYLVFEGIEAPAGGWLKLGKVTFYPFKGNDGGYANETDSGYQILLNWRGAAGSFKHVSIAEVMEGKIYPNLFRDRMVLIGAYAPSLNDTVLTPFVKRSGANNNPPYGVEVHAQLVSQIVSAVLDGRPLVKVLPDWAEYLWIVFWIGASTMGAWGIRNRKNPFILLLCTIAYSSVLTVVIFGIAVSAFLQAWWIPLVPALYGIWGSAILSVANDFAWRRVREKEENQQKLEQRVKEREQELEEKNQIILAQSYEAFLGNNLTGFLHECNNVFYNFSKSTARIKEKIDLIHDFLKNKEIIDPVQEELFKKIDYWINGQIEDREKGLAFLKRYLPVAPEESNHRPAQENIELNSFIKEGFWLNLKHKQNKDSIKIDCLEEYNDSIKAISVVPSELNFVVDNLLNNAYYALNEKKKKQLDNFVPTLKIITKQLSDKIQIIIQDNGIGVEPNIESEIFKMHFTTKPTGQGIGLGLFHARNIIVGRYQGSLYHQSVETERGRETQFIIELPVCKTLGSTKHRSFSY